MTEFGQNGTIASPTEGAASGYAVEVKPKIKRVALASFLCGVAASVSVAIIAAIVFFISSTVLQFSGVSASSLIDGRGFFSGATMALAMAAFNWYFFYFTVPAAWLAIGLSLGPMPRRGLTRAMPYYRWGAIWGAILVGGTTSFFGLLLGNDIMFGSAAQNSVSFVIGVSLTGIGIGALAGLLCGALFIAIVRPAEQVRKVDVDVF